MWNYNLISICVAEFDLIGRVLERTSAASPIRLVLEVLEVATLQHKKALLPRLGSKQGAAASLLHLKKKKRCVRKSESPFHMCTGLTCFQISPWHSKEGVEARAVVPPSSATAPRLETGQVGVGAGAGTSFSDSAMATDLSQGGGFDIGKGGIVTRGEEEEGGGEGKDGDGGEGSGEEISAETSSTTGDA